MKSMIKVREECRSEEGQEFIAIKVSDLYSYTPLPPGVVGQQHNWREMNVYYNSISSCAKQLLIWHWNVHKLFLYSNGMVTTEHF